MCIRDSHSRRTTEGRGTEQVALGPRKAPLHIRIVGAPLRIFFPRCGVVIPHVFYHQHSALLATLHASPPA
eukprot:13546079-Alexandrium_andersonii.AAC.1